MSQIPEPPVRRPPEQVDAERLGWAGVEPRRTRPSAGRTAAVVVLYVAIGLASAAVGYTLAGGRMVAGGASPTLIPSSMVTPSSATAAQVVPAATAPPAATVPGTVQAAAPAPTLAPTAPPPTSQPAASPAKPEEDAAPSGQGAHLAVRPGMDARQAQIEGTISEYFEALGARDFARAQQVCCTAEWRARYPLNRWERNFDGVSDLRMVGQPRYVRLEQDVAVVDTDYTFVSAGAQRTFTLRWTFTPVGSAWQGDLAEATAAE